MATTGYEKLLETKRSLDSFTYKRRAVQCCRKRCAGCPHEGYWYAYWKESGVTRSIYLGKELSEDVARVIRSDKKHR